jgi:hypothetical protein
MDVPDDYLISKFVDKGIVNYALFIKLDKRMKFP